MVIDCFSCQPSKYTSVCPRIRYSLFFIIDDLYGIGQPNNFVFGLLALMWHMCHPGPNEVMEACSGTRCR